MRKYALLAALAASMFLVVAIAFGADNTQTAKFTVTKTKAGTKLNPRSTGITTDLNNTGTDPSPAKLVVLHFDKNLVFGGANFPSCTLAKSTRNACPANTRVGSGQANARTGPSSTIDLKITAFNGPGGKSLLLALRGAIPVDLEAKLSRDSGLFGTKLTTVVPKATYNAAPGFFTPLVKFLAIIPARTIRKSGKTRPFIGLTGCTGGKLKFRAEFTWASKTDAAGNVTKPAPPKLTINQTQRCTR